MHRHKAKMLLIILLMLGVFSALTMFIWNTVLTAALGLASISFWQALGLLVLCRILFGGLGFRGFMHGGMGGHRPDHWHKMDAAQKRELLNRFGGFHERFHGHPGLGRPGPGFGHGRPEHGHGPNGHHQHGEGRPGRPENGRRCCGRAEACDSQSQEAAPGNNSEQEAK